MKEEVPAAVISAGETMTVNGRDYTVLRLLGHGKGGYSYLVTDGAEESVLKQIHHEPCDYYQFAEDKLGCELRDYQRLRELGIRLPVLYEADAVRERLRKEYIPGETVAALVRRDALPSEYLAQVKEMSAVLRAAGLNIDYYPTNFVARDGLLYYIDYECNPYMDKWSFENWGSQYWQKGADLP